MKRCALMILMLSGVLFAQSKTDGKMIHIDFKSMEGDGMTMKASLPLSLISSVQPQINQALEQVRQEQNIDYKAIWAAIKEAGPTEFMNIKKNDMDVKVTTTEKLLKIFLDEKQAGDEYNVTIPLALGDILFSGDELDFDKLIDALLALDGQDIVKIDSFQFKGRAWVE